MPATADAINRGTGATSSVLLNFDVIRQRAADKLGITPQEITDQVLADLFELDSRTTVWRFRTGRTKPGLDTALDMATKLGIPVEDFAVRVKAGE